MTRASSVALLALALSAATAAEEGPLEDDVCLAGSPGCDDHVSLMQLKAEVGKQGRQLKGVAVHATDAEQATVLSSLPGALEAEPDLLIAASDVPDWGPDRIDVEGTPGKAVEAKPWDPALLSADLPRYGRSSPADHSDSDKHPEQRSLVATMATVVQHVAANESAKDATLVQRLQRELVYELDLPLDPINIPKVSKVTLALVNGLGLGCCGIDRCIMGQTVLGVIKGITLGGLGVWFVVDSVIITVNCLMSWDSIGALGFHAQFEEKDIQTAVWVCLVFMLLHSCGGKGFHWHKSKKEGQ